MDEFIKWFKIFFTYRGKDFEFTIHCNHLETNDNNWFYRIELYVDGEYFDADVFGTMIDGHPTSQYQFGVDVYINDDDIYTIDDVDIIDGE